MLILSCISNPGTVLEKEFEKERKLLDILHNVVTLLCCLKLAGPWQVMLKQADGSYACVAESTTRFTLGEVRILISLSSYHWKLQNYVD